MKRTLVAIPMKDPTFGKTRLAGELSPTQRAALSLHLFEATLAKLASVDADVLTVTRSAVVADLARDLGVPSIRERHPSLNSAARTAHRYARTKGYGALCILPGDLADPSLEDLAAFIGHPADAALCPSLDFGTNGLLIPASADFAFAYGPGSYHAHAKAAVRLAPVTLPLPSLRRDVDRPSDLAHLPPEALAICKQEDTGAPDRHAHGDR